MFLVDGHNLIGQLQDLSLDDPQDEAKLTMAVKRFCMRGNLKATIIFDNGLPGGVSRTLSNSQVTVIFAPPGVQADALIMRRARDIGNFNEMVLVTSDRRILRLAFAYGITTLSSEEFALMLGFRPVEIDPQPAPPPEKARVKIIYEKDPDPVVTKQEIAYWLPIFKQRLEQARAERMARELAEREARRAVAARRRKESE
ncbi:MAG TPA: NYN domain-containing protein [Aggregatilineales bacterium]|nr:NYN domain-containing protein [Aggregatilineales bacterium]